jgi:hypothetical protein
MPGSGSSVTVHDVERGTHDTPKIVRRLHDERHIAEIGESDRTPLILVGEVWVVVATVALAVLALSLFAYRLAS